MSTRNKAIAALLIIGLLAASIFGACSQTPAPGDKIGIAVSILPLAEFAESIGGDKVAVSVMVPPGAEPHSYEPKPSQMTALSNAALYIKVGSGIEFEISYMDKLAAVNTSMLIVDCSQGIDLMQSRDEHEQGMDPHIWTSVKNAMIMAETICSGLVKIDPDNTAYYENNRDHYIAKLKKLDSEISSGLSTVTNRSFIIYHPAFGYFARDYNLNQISIEQEGKEPTATYITRVIQQAKELDCRVVFVSPQFSDKSAAVIAKEINGSVVAVDTLARDYIAGMEKIKKAMIEAMR